VSCLRCKHSYEVLSWQGRLNCPGATGSGWFSVFVTKNWTCSKHRLKLSHRSRSSHTKDFGRLILSGFVNSCRRFAAGHHKPPFFFYFFKLLFLLLPFSTGKDFTLPPALAEVTPSPGYLPGAVPPVPAVGLIAQ